MRGGPHIDHYDWPGGREAMLRFGDGDPRVVLALPLFEEYNRTRAFGVTLLRSLAGRGIGGLLPDWPGTAESLLPTSSVTLDSMLAAYRSLADGYGPMFAIGIRSGALIDRISSPRGRWYLSPQSGEELSRELARQISREGDVAGNLLSPAFLAELGPARYGSARVVRMETDPRDADRKLPGSPLWRRVEPGNDPALAALLAEDIAQWIESCGG